MKMILVMRITLILWFATFLAQAKEEEKLIKAKSHDVTLSKKELYKYGFQVKRGEQIDGVKRILKIKDYGKQFKMVKILVEKLFMVLSKAKLEVIEFGFIPGGDFPDDQNQRDSLGRVFENVAMFGDLILRLPDVTHKVYDSNREWKLVITWGVVLANESGIFEGANEQLLNLMSQELNIIPREENYVNPYKEVTKKKEQKRKEEEQRRQDREKERKKKSKLEKKRKAKGPRLGGGSRREL